MMINDWIVSTFSASFSLFILPFVPSRLQPLPEISFRLHTHTHTCIALLSASFGILNSTVGSRVYKRDALLISNHPKVSNQLNKQNPQPKQTHHENHCSLRLPPRLGRRCLGPTLLWRLPGCRLWLSSCVRWLRRLSW